MKKKIKSRAVPDPLSIGDLHKLVDLQNRLRTRVLRLLQCLYPMAELYHLDRLEVQRTEMDDGTPLLIFRVDSDIDNFVFQLPADAFELSDDKVLALARRLIRKGKPSYFLHGRRFTPVLKKFAPVV